MFSQRRSHYWSQQGRTYYTTCCIVALLYNSVCSCFALLRFITTWKFLRRSFSLKGLVQSSKKSQRKKKSWQSCRANALRDNYMENIIKCSHPIMTGQNDGQDERLTGQVHDQAGHCLLTGHYFEPWTSLTESKIYNNRLSEAKIKKLHILVKC